MLDRWCVRCGRPDMTPYLKTQLPKLKKLLNERPAGEIEVVDIGCGTGRNMKGLVAAGFDPGKVRGYDMCPDKAGVSGLWLGHDPFPREDNTTDLFLANYVFMFLNDEEIRQVMAEINRTAKLGAVIIIELYPAKDSRIHDDYEMGVLKNMLISAILEFERKGLMWACEHNIKGKCILRLIDREALNG